MKKLNYRAGFIALATTLALNGAHMLAYFYQAKSPAFDVLALAVGWGVDFPGVLGVIVVGALGGIPLFWQDDVSSDRIVFAAMAMFSGFTWFLVAAAIFRKKPNKSAQTTPGLTFDIGQ